MSVLKAAIIKSFAILCGHTWASLQSWEGYPPPEFFLISTPPLQEGLSWAKYSPPRKNFWANYLKISPPRKNIFGKFQENSGILVKSCKGYPPLWGWKIYPPPKNFQKNIPPLWNFRNLSPPWELGACPRMYIEIQKMLLLLCLKRYCFQLNLFHFLH